MPSFTFLKKPFPEPQVNVYEHIKKKKNPSWGYPSLSAKGHAYTSNLSTVPSPSLCSRARIPQTCFPPGGEFPSQDGSSVWEREERERRWEKGIYGSCVGCGFIPMRVETIDENRARRWARCAFNILDLDFSSLVVLRLSKLFFITSMLVMHLESSKKKLYLLLVEIHLKQWQVCQRETECSKSPMEIASRTKNKRLSGRQFSADLGL